MRMLKQSRHETHNLIYCPVLVFYNYSVITMSRVHFQFGTKPLILIRITLYYNQAELLHLLTMVSILPSETPRKYDQLI